MDFFEPGISLDDFEIGSVIQDGAMARIFQGTDRLSGETVALKVPFKDILNNPLPYYHHQTEDRVLRLLTHPYIVRSIRRPRTSLYLALEWVDGPDLKSLLWRHGRMAQDQVITWAGQILEALIYMHALGVHHLDLKPENIMRASNGSIKLVDFGLAWLRDTRDLLLEDFDNPHGTPDYAAPEQIRGMRHDHRSDLYSLGLVLYELLTGEFPFRRSTHLKEVRKRAGIKPIPLRRHVPGMPNWLEAIILKALAPDPERRYPSAQAMAAALQIGANGGRAFGTSTAGVTEADGPSRASPASGRPRPQLLGAVTDHPGADEVVEVLRREALRLDGEVTLLTVNTEMDDSDLVRYATAVEGAQLGRRLEGYVHTLRNHGLDPIVRIRQGDCLEEILSTARALSAGLIVVGDTRRRGISRLFRGRLVDKLIRKAPCRVIAAHHSASSAPSGDLQLSTLQHDDLLDIDFFLHDNWVICMNHLATVSRPYAVPEDQFPDEMDDRLQNWLQALARQPEWQPLIRELDARHQRLQAVIKTLTEAARERDQDRLRRCYLTKALPRLCEFRQAMRDFSLALKAQTAVRESGVPSLLNEADCPPGAAGGAPDGPPATLRAIHDYFCRHPEASPEACLVHLRGRAALPVDPGRKN